MYAEHRKMGRKKIDKKIHHLIELCSKSQERALFIVLGQASRDQIVLLHHIFLSIRNRVNKSDLPILWCFKKDNGFSFICNKMQQFLKKKYSRNYSLSEEDCFAHFLASAKVQFCHYNNSRWIFDDMTTGYKFLGAPPPSTKMKYIFSSKTGICDTTSVLGQTFSMLIIQDFEAVTPNILARIVECIEGGGIIIIILPTVQSLQEFAFMEMDAHSKYVTSAYPNIDPIFNFRFVMSLADCKNCMILDDNLKILHCHADLDSIDISQISVKKKNSCAIHNASSQVLERIISLCCTVDQSKALQTFINALGDKSSRSVLSLTSARGRGKSATLGLAISAALYWKYSRVFVTSPQVENLQTLFKFILNGLKAFDYKEGKDYSITYSNRLINGINIFHDQKQIVNYLLPTEFSQVGSSDLVVIDEAAAIPLPIVKKWFKSDIVFMASTVNGYEGTGRSLSLKLMNQLREKSLQHLSCNGSFTPSKKTFILNEITLNEAIRYANEDSIEAWLNKLFCLDTEISYWSGSAPDPEHCALYYVNKKILFSYQKVSEKFLQQLTALFVSSHYKNSPNDLLMIADAPSHHLFCLLPPISKNMLCLPDVLCVIQVALEGKISKECVTQEFSHGKRASGDLIPWIISQQFQDYNFPSLSGARIVRITTHPNMQRMGYGKRALELMFSYYGKCKDLCASRSGTENKESTLLLSLDELKPNKLDYIGVSYGLTLELLKFWKKLDFVPLYLRQTANETTGEHSCVMIKYLDEQNPSWLSIYLSDFLQRFLILLCSAFKNLPAQLALEMLNYRKDFHLKVEDYSGIEVRILLNPCSMKRIQAYCNHLVDYHLIMDLIPVIAKCYFFGYFQDYFLSSIQENVLLSMSLQNKSVEEISEVISMETNQVMGIFMKLVKKILQHLDRKFKSNQTLQIKDQDYKAIQDSSSCENSEFKRTCDYTYQKKNKKHKHKLSS